ncbi:TIM barrel protein [Thermocladium modestius]|uniref:TIM barrel protein n=1 Tax=Thermocladium modestius TaxID=62609 RepID=UPI00166BFEC5|nr:TIM barrel protein [Thermocladium modestius]
MARVYLGPAGIPITLRQRKKNAGTADAVSYVREIGLNAMEVEFVQGVRMSRESAREVGEAAKEAGVRLSIHAPYFINLCSEEESKVRSSVERLRDSLDRGNTMGASVVVFHSAYYGKLGHDVCIKKVGDEMRGLIGWMEDNDISVKLGLETMARESQLGPLEEILDLVRSLSSPLVTAVVDWGHVYARNGGSIDFARILDEWSTALPGEVLHSHFTCVKFRNGKWVDEHEPLDAAAPPFEPLAEELGRRRELTVSIISETPLIEVDALKMRDILERYGNELATAEANGRKR